MNDVFVDGMDVVKFTKSRLSQHLHNSLLEINAYLKAVQQKKHQDKPARSADSKLTTEDKLKRYTSRNNEGRDNPVINIWWKGSSLMKEYTPDVLRMPGLEDHNAVEINEIFNSTPTTTASHKNIEVLSHSPDAFRKEIKPYFNQTHLHLRVLSTPKRNKTTKPFPGIDQFLSPPTHTLDPGVFDGTETYPTGPPIGPGETFNPTLPKPPPTSTIPREWPEFDESPNGTLWKIPQIPNDPKIQSRIIPQNLDTTRRPALNTENPNTAITFSKNPAPITLPSQKSDSPDSNTTPGFDIENIYKPANQPEYVPLSENTAITFSKSLAPVTLPSHNSNSPDSNTPAPGNPYVPIETFKNRNLNFEGKLPASTVTSNYPAFPDAPSPFSLSPEKEYSNQLQDPLPSKALTNTPSDKHPHTQYPAFPDNLTYFNFNLKYRTAKQYPNFPLEDQPQYSALPAITNTRNGREKSQFQFPTSTPGYDPGKETAKLQSQYPVFPNEQMYPGFSNPDAARGITPGFERPPNVPGKYGGVYQASLSPTRQTRDTNKRSNVPTMEATTVEQSPVLNEIVQDFTAKAKIYKEHVREVMIKDNIGPMNVFILEFTKLVAAKTPDNVKRVLIHAFPIVQQMNLTGQLDYFGYNFRDMTLKAAFIASGGATQNSSDEVAKRNVYAGETYKYLKDRRRMLPEHINYIIEYADSLYENHEEKELIANLLEFEQHPYGTSKTDYDLCKSMIDAFIAPLKRLKGTVQREKLINMINEAIATWPPFIETPNIYPRAVSTQEPKNTTTTYQFPDFSITTVSCPYTSLSSTIQIVIGRRKANHNYKPYTKEYTYRHNRQTKRKGNNINRHPDYNYERKLRNNYYIPRNMPQRPVPVTTFQTRFYIISPAKPKVPMGVIKTSPAFYIPERPTTTFKPSKFDGSSSEYRVVPSTRATRSSTYYFCNIEMGNKQAKHRNSDISELAKRRKLNAIKVTTEPQTTSSYILNERRSFDRIENKRKRFNLKKDIIRKIRDPPIRVPPSPSISFYTPPSRSCDAPVV